MSDKPDGVIRISKEEALDSHVDDMLKRQMSLRGEPGVTREHGRRWYYQNWFIFMIVGMLGAVLAWAILEPGFDDSFYIQGKITAIDPGDTMPVPASEKDEKGSRLLSFAFFGSVTIDGQKIFLPRGMKELLPNGRKPRVDFSKLEVGQTIGLYVEYEKEEEFDAVVGEFLVSNPPPQSKPSKSIEQQSARSRVIGMIIFAVVAGMIGLFLGAADGLVCRIPRRALMCGVVGLLVGLVGGMISSILAGIAYAPLNALAMKQSAGTSALSTMGFGIQLVGRSLAWGLSGLAMGLGQGIALRSTRLLLYGLIGGVVGGLLGGLFFDPIDLILLGPDKPSAHWSRLIGFAVIGGTVGAMIGIVELLARDAWLRMTQGPLTGKEFLIFKDAMNIGSSPRSDIYLFNDPLVAENHAVIRATGDACEIEARQTQQPILINNRSVTRARLRPGDTVTIGRTVFVFQQRKA
jgi:hypothetical protein